MKVYGDITVEESANGVQYVTDASGTRRNASVALRERIAFSQYYGSRVHSRVYYGEYFITSDRRAWDADRRYSVRRLTENGVETLGFRACLTKREALNTMHHRARGGVLQRKEETQ